jgi:hypothetical protein
MDLQFKNVACHVSGTFMQGFDLNKETEFSF